MIDHALVDQVTPFVTKLIVQLIRLNGYILISELSERGVGLSTFSLPYKSLTYDDFLKHSVYNESTNNVITSQTTCLCVTLDKDAADKLSKTVDEACLLLAEYNGRLAAELEDRRQLARMLTEYISSQREALMEREKKLEARRHTHTDITAFYYLSTAHRDI